MKRTLGIILIVLGIGAFFLDGLSFTQEKTILDAGPLQVTADEEKSFKWPTYTGVILTVLGVGLILFDRRSK
jgi:multisubunit Na+/H+ antiporter MnhG subunit